MNTRRSKALAALAMTFAFAMPLAGQEADVAKQGEASAAAMEKSNNEAMGEAPACPCSCMNMQEMHGKMMDSDQAAGASGGMGGMQGMKSDSATAGAHAGMHSGMDPEAHAAMMKAHQEMMANCDCAAAAEGAEGQAGMQGMSCSMHGQQGAEGMQGMKMKGEGMQHRHGVQSDSEGETPDAGDSGGR